MRELLLAQKFALVNRLASIDGYVTNPDLRIEKDSLRKQIAVVDLAIAAPNPTAFVEGWIGDKLTAPSQVPTVRNTEKHHANNPYIKGMMDES